MGKSRNDVRKTMEEVLPKSLKKMTMEDCCASIRSLTETILMLDKRAYEMSTPAAVGPDLIEQRALLAEVRDMVRYRKSRIAQAGIAC